jgi:hypothetical protein
MPMVEFSPDNNQALLTAYAKYVETCAKLAKDKVDKEDKFILNKME